MIDMKLTYSTRDGRPVRLLCVDGPSKNYPVIGIMEGSDPPQSWANDGQFDKSRATSSYDLIEVTPKAKVELWGVVYKYKGESEIYVEWFNSPSDSLDSIFNQHVTILARAIPFKWSEE